MREIVGYRESNFLGIPYETIISKEYEDPIDAWDDFNIRLEEFLEGKKGTIVWRVKPKLQSKFEEDKFYVVAKVLVYPDNIIKMLRERGLVFWKNGKGRNNPYHINELPKEVYERNPL